MKKLRAILIDDERHGLNNLSSKIENYCSNYIEIVAKETSAENAILSIDTIQPDIIFLDIQMPRMDGFQLLDNLAFKNFFLIITTAFSEYGIKAVKASAIDYLLKPIDPDELLNAVKRSHTLFLSQKYKVSKASIHLLKENLNAKSYPKQIIVFDKDDNKILNVDDIIYMEAEANYCSIYLLIGSKILCSKTLKHFESLTDPDIFLRIHKSFLVNKNYIVEVEKTDQYSLIMHTGIKLPIARRRVKMVLQKLAEE